MPRLCTALLCFRSDGFDLCRDPKCRSCDTVYPWFHGAGKGIWLSSNWVYYSNIQVEISPSGWYMHGIFEWTYQLGICPILRSQRLAVSSPTISWFPGGCVIWTGGWNLNVTKKNQQLLGLNGDGSKPWYLVNPKIAGIYGCSSHYSNVSIGIDPYPNILQSSFWLLSLSASEAPGPRKSHMVSPVYPPSVAIPPRHPKESVQGTVDVSPHLDKHQQVTFGIYQVLSVWDYLIDLID